MHERGGNAAYPTMPIGWIGNKRCVRTLSPRLWRERSCPPIVAQASAQKRFKTTLASGEHGPHANLNNTRFYLPDVLMQ